VPRAEVATEGGRVEAWVGRKQGLARNVSLFCEKNGAFDRILRGGDGSRGESSLLQCMYCAIVQPEQLIFC
jgi:hypothetical protein